VIRRALVFGMAFSMISIAASADVVGDDEPIPIPPPPQEAPPPPPPPPPPPEEPVTAAPPPWVQLQSRALGAGIGVRWGQGVLNLDGDQHAFSLKGLALGDVGAARFVGEGDVHNLERIEDFAGTYVAVEAGVAAGSGVSRLAMRNQHGVVISLQSKLEGAQLTLGAEGFRIELE